MIDMARYWEIWSPYWTYIEENFLDSESIGKLTTIIRVPALVVGAGQGLLIEELQKRGLEVDGVDSEPLMVEFAEKRRGLKLIQADGANLPFSDGSYRTCIIATGVIDFSDDESNIGSIMNEALRVTHDGGKVLVAFYRFHPKVEELMRYTGLITNGSSWCYRRTLEMMRLKPLELFVAIKNDPNVSVLGALLTSVRTQVFLPKKEKRATKNWAKAWEKAKQDSDDPEALFRCSPEFIPYRNEDQIRNLFKNLNITLAQTLVLNSCIVAQITMRTGDSRE